MSQSIVLSCASTLILMHAFLGFNVSKQRVETRKNHDSDYQVNALEKAIRAHGNASEYNAILIALFLFIALRDPANLITTLCVVSAGFRVLNAIGLLMIEKVGDRHPMRFAGALGTYACFSVFAIVLVFY